MAGGVRVRRRTGSLLAVAAVLGVLVGAGAFAVAPLPIRPQAGAVVVTASTSGPAPATSTTPAAPASTATAARATPTPRPSSPRPSSSSSLRAASPSPSRTPVAGPPFTERALLQTSELLQHGWAKAAELSLQPGVAMTPLLRCVRLDRLPEQPVAAYAATYQGLHTEAAEQVVRFAGTADATSAVNRLVAQVDACDEAPSSRRATVGTRHEPDLEGITDVVWWNVRGAGADDPMRGVLALVRVDDRLVALYLHATTTDPAKTTDVLPLMRQAGLRLV